MVPDVFPFFSNLGASGRSQDMNDILGLPFEPPLFPMPSPSTVADGLASSQQMDDFFWQNSTGSTMGFPWDFWTEATEQQAELQIGLLPDFSLSL
jgi:hypothetical protein